MFGNCGTLPLSRIPAPGILAAWDSCLDQGLLCELGAEPAMRDYEPLAKYLERQDALMKRPVPASPQE